MSTFMRTDPSVHTLTRQSGYWRDLDWILLIAAVATTIFGSMLVWSASEQGDWQNQVVFLPF